jgi:hypothetical protein
VLHVIEDEDEWNEDELDGDPEDVLDAALSAGDRADQNLDYDYQETELLCRAMRAAGYGYLGTDRDGELLRFTDDNLQDIVFANWPEVREWLEYVILDDPDVSDAVERVLHPERFARKLEYRSHASYAALRDPDDGQYFTISAPFTEGLDTQKRRDDWLLCTVAKHIAFSDCGGYDVQEIVIDGRPVEYIGWQPGMRYEFADCETKEIIWSASFPEWDH